MNDTHIPPGFDFFNGAVSGVVAGLELTAFVKADGPLSKRIYLNSDGKVVSDGSACVMSSGSAKRLPVPDLTSFGAMLGKLKPHMALALGRLRSDLPEQVVVTTKQNLVALGKDAPANVIARTAEYIGYAPGVPALALIDFDRKAMPAEVARKIDAAGGVYEALRGVLPQMENAGTVGRRSTSAGLGNVETGEEVQGSGGTHLYVLVGDGADIPRFLTALHQRCWLAGFGWFMVGAGGQLLERSIVDRSVGAPERLVFEGAPEVVLPLYQDKSQRQPLVQDGGLLDTRQRCPDLSATETSILADMMAAEREKMKPEADRQRASFIDVQVRRLVAKGLSPLQARKVIERQIGGVLLPDVLLHLDDGSEVTVAAILAEPDKYMGATLADPVEGVAYGRGKAKVLRRSDGSLWIHSFAHGGANYALKYDAANIETAIKNCAVTDVAELLVRLLLLADVEVDEEDQLIDIVVERTKGKKRPLVARIKAARNQRDHANGRERRAEAAKKEIRGRVRLPWPDAPVERLPVLRSIDEVLCNLTVPEPPMRDLEGVPTEIRVSEAKGLHQISAAMVNGEASEAELKDLSRLPSPPMALLTRHDLNTLELELEKHIAFVPDMSDPDSKPLTLGFGFIAAYMKWRDSQLPKVTSIVTAPVVMPDKSLLAVEGLHRETGAVFRIPPELMRVLPKAEECDDAAVIAAMRFLLDEWLVDVNTGFTGKCTLIAMALSIMERALLEERPGFIVTAGKRGGGKTTAFKIVALATTGLTPPAARWSPDAEERRKAITSYLALGLPFLLWDNIPRGAALSCPHLEATLTSATISDRILGETRNITADATTIQAFTGNNITAKGDLASRTLNIRIETDRPDPENRPFTHPDVCGWTLAHRGQLLRCMYVILLGNRANMQKNRTTRFKTWWRLVGSAVEYAAGLLEESKTEPVDFADLFEANEAEDEEQSGTVGVLEALREWLALIGWAADAWFTAADVAAFVNRPVTVDDDFMAGPGAEKKLSREELEAKEKDQAARRAVANALRECLAPNSRDHRGGDREVSANMIGRNLRNLSDAPVLIGDQIGVLRRKNSKDKNVTTVFRVEVKADRR